MGKTQRTNTGAKVLIISAFCFVFVLFLSLFRMMFLGEQAEAEHNLESPSRVVFLGTSGVSWDILDPVSAPNLFAAATAKSAEIANFIVKINADTACPDAGWLTVNTGVRTNGLADFSMRCRTFPQVNQIEGQWQIANWEQYPEVNSANKYRPIFGNLAQVLSGNGKKIGAIGAGAALALADNDGKLPDSAVYVPGGSEPRQTSFPPTPQLLAASVDKMKDAQVILADLGVVRAGFSPLTAEKQKDSHSAGAFHASFHLPNSAAASLRSELKSLDSRFAAVVKALQIQDAAVQKATGKQPRTMVIFASLAEADRSGAKMQSYFKVNLANLHTDFSRSAFPAEKLPAANRNNLAFPIPDASRLAYTNSTRIPGVVQNTDILPTLAAITAEKNPVSESEKVLPDTRNAVGAPITQYIGKTTSGSQLEYLRSENERAKYVRASLGYAFIGFSVFSGFSAIAAVFYLRQVKANKRKIKYRKKRRKENQLRAGSGARHLTMLLLTVSAVPAASFLINLIPWWYLPFPRFSGLLLICLLAAAIAEISRRLAKILSQRIQSQVSAGVFAVAIIAAGTVFTLVFDVLNGSYLHFSSIFGVQAQHAGRFYGFGNSTFVIFALSMLVLAAFGLQLMRIADTPVWQRYAFAAVMLCFAIYVDGAPILGADFGGPPAMVLAFNVLLLLHLGQRLNRRSTAVLMILGILGAFSIAMLDWFKPKGQRTHLGEFIASVLRGDFFLVISRKFGEMFADISVYVWICVFGIVCALAAAVIRGIRKRGEKVRNLLNTDLRIELDRQGVKSAVLPADFAACQAAAAALLVFGLAINDSGLLLPFIGLFCGVPMCFAIVMSNVQEHFAEKAAETVGS